ncbi:hypothetical protein CIW83_01650 [Tissierella sp. P1]|jgi:nitrogen regulatory protein P-II 1|uniref:hypothetical protein n=1 Tax=Tissierella TaxID=41273 RepID=UPI000BA05BE7|nr:hypothetical protein [Tissierella sp. P1]OZV13674.1 hypothetical protein CIW83_01650 [Tissierella sp. P1]
MNILFLVLNEVEYLDEILDAFVDVGVRGATILDSQGMGSALTNGGKDLPFFGALRNLLDDSRPYNKTIFTVIEDENVLNDAVKAVKEILGDMEKPGVGLMFTLPVGKIYGMRD